jgi:aminopeptidase-like protein
MSTGTGEPRTETLPLVAEPEHAVWDEMYAWARDLFPVNRSITGEGVRRTLAYLGGIVPGMTVHEVPSGTRCFDWEVPPEWNVRDAYVADESGRRVIDFQANNLHLVGYSVPVDAWMTLDELQPHLHSLPEQPDAIPYITSYYARRWGFCLSHARRQALRPGRYRVVVDATLEPGSLTYGEVLLAGRDEAEVLVSTYVCHPSMANNELSGPVVATALARWLAALPGRRLSYRFVFIPETIGSIAYLSRHLDEMRRRTLAGYVATCVGDDRAYSFLPSRHGATVADRVTRHVMRHHAPGFREYTFLDRGSDERQYCAPGVDLPVCSVMRTKYYEYPEYHTSLDDLDLISPAGLGGAYEVLRRCMLLLERNRRWRSTVLCEPQLGRRGLYPTLSTRESTRMVEDLMNVWTYCDGERDLVAIADTLGMPAERCYPVVDLLERHGLLQAVD